MGLHIVAVGQDAYWLTAVKKATSRLAGAPSETLECQEDLTNCLSALPAPDPDAVLLVDASGQSEIERIVALLRSRGWKYVIVVAADPSAKEAVSVLRKNLGYDYWEKTYDKHDIGERVRESLDEIQRERLAINRERRRPGEPRQRIE